MGPDRKKRYAARRRDPLLWSLTALTHYNSYTVLRNNCDFLFAKTTLTLNEVEKEIICCTFVNFQETTERLSFFSSMKISLRLLLSFVRLLFCSLWLYPLFCILKPRHPSIKTSTAVVRYFPKLSLFFFFFLGNSCKNDNLSFESLLGFIVLVLWFAQVV